MSKYCLDSNVFIQAKNGPYGFDIVPAFWDWIDTEVERNHIITSSEVYSEIAEGDDDLALWFKDRKESGLFMIPDQEVQKINRNITDYITRNYESVYYQVFLEKADP